VSAFRFPGFPVFITMYVAWTTVATAEDASRLAQGALEARLVACVQVDGPVTSHYPWKGRIESAREYRLVFKFLPEQADALETWIGAHHPYDIPEWIVARAEHVSEKYLSWARGTSTPGPSQK
jgi:periplasmic divalent cation tolerance protein